MSQVTVLRVAVVAGLSFIATGRMVQIRQAVQVDSRPHGRYTLDQILGRSLPLLAALNSFGEPLNLSGSRLMTWNAGMAMPVWVVDGTQSHGDFNIHLMWDAETGELMSACRPVFGVSQGVGRLLTCKEAQRISSSWLTTLGMCEQTAARRPAASTMNGIAWDVKWWTDTGGAEISIDSHTGDFIWAKRRPLLPEPDAVFNEIVDHRHATNVVEKLITCSACG